MEMKVEVVQNTLGSPSGPDLSDRRQWTNNHLAANVLVYVAQYVSNGKLLHWGAKINSLVSKGQLWRLATCSFLHANLGHLLVNCYSLNATGPAVEKICGPERYLTVYMSSAVAGSAMSYWFSKAASVGASGAIFGLTIGLLAPCIDNLCHVGGFLGGAAVSWLVGPA